uniref:DUF2065 domain-containing protein n=1 Tax=Thaumasiovibrio occultus TaxID=1891184 RepID=UPI000B352AA7|nr:DUF2065 domain-containing protein [Thaumasiovibrio occultus]
METFLLAVGLMLIAESIGPTLFPSRWRELMLELSRQQDNQLRRMGGCILVTGVVIVYTILKSL